MDQYLATQTARPLVAALAARPSLSQRQLALMAQKLLSLVQHFSGNGEASNVLDLVLIQASHLTSIALAAGIPIGLLDFATFVVHLGSVKLVVLGSLQQMELYQTQFDTGPYAAPEVQAGAESTVAAEAYSAGVILFVLR